MYRLEDFLQNTKLGKFLGLLTGRTRLTNMVNRNDDDICCMSEVLYDFCWYYQFLAFSKKVESGEEQIDERSMEDLRKRADAIKQEFDLDDDGEDPEYMKALTEGRLTAIGWILGYGCDVPDFFKSEHDSEIRSDYAIKYKGVYPQYALDD
jgi:hypothetical protein